MRRRPVIQAVGQPPRIVAERLSRAKINRAVGAALDRDGGIIERDGTQRMDARGSPVLPPLHASLGCLVCCIHCQYPLSEVRREPHPVQRASESRGYQPTSISCAAFDLKFLTELITGGQELQTGGTSPV